MEFHDILHGRIEFADKEKVTSLLADLLSSPEINRLRNMRQMNFDVPLIQELGRSRRLPHSIGVAHTSYVLSKRSRLKESDSLVLMAAAMLHDAAIPPYGHLVESEFKSLVEDFSHEKRVEGLIRGTISAQNKFQQIVPGKPLQLSSILRKYDIELESVIGLICPSSEKGSPISADVDLDNIDNVHRMAAMLGWEGAKENFESLVQDVSLNGLGPMSFSDQAIGSLSKWLDYRQRIYTMIIAHPECIPYNALQVDLVREAVLKKLITPEEWWLSEPEFEARLRSNEKGPQGLAWQLITGCEYSLIDYVWIKNFKSPRKKNNAEIVWELTRSVPLLADQGYFVWNEKRLISRRIRVLLGKRQDSNIGVDSTSCMIALVKKTPGKAKWTKATSANWRRDVLMEFTRIFETHEFELDFPETYTGNFLGQKNSEIQIDY